MIFIPLMITLLFYTNINAQVGIGTETPDAQLDIRASDPAAPASTDGILIPRVDALIGINDESDYPEKYAIERIKRSGFLAQEVEQAALDSGYDFSGVTAPQGDVKYYSMAYAEFVVPLVKAVQEQQMMIENYEIRITKDEKRIVELKRENAIMKDQILELITRLGKLENSDH